MPHPNIPASAQAIDWVDRVLAYGPDATACCGRVRGEWQLTSQGLPPILTAGFTPERHRIVDGLGR